MSTGIDALDAVLGGLYWGDNVVWQLDSAPVRPFYRAVAALTGTFESRTFVSLGTHAEAFGGHGVEVIDAGPASEFADPADLLREVHRLCHPPGRRLLLFGSLDSMARAWGVNKTRAFFSRCCPFLLEVGAVAYWWMSASPRHLSSKPNLEAFLLTNC